MNPGRRRFRWGVLCALMLGAVGTLEAQVCIGFPTAAGQGAVALSAGFPTGGNDFGVEGGYHMQWGAAVYGGAGLHSLTGSYNATSFGAGAAFVIPELRAALPVGLFSCPTVSATVTTGVGDENLISVPVGLGLATIIPVGPTMTLSPYAIPALRWTTWGARESSTDWTIEGGAVLLGFLGPRLYAGATINRVFVEGAESVLGVKIGYVLQ